MMFSKLLERGWKDDGTWSPMPDLADSWDVSPDGTQWTIHLHPGVKWQDGQPFTAADVKFTIDASFTYPIRFVNTWEAIVGSDDVKAGKTKETSGVKVVDDNTIQFTLKEPNSDYFSDLADPQSVIMPKHILESLADPKGIETSEFATTKPIGTGPYKFVKYETDQYSEFVANHDYFKGAPKIEHVFIKRLSGDQAIAQLESGDLDLSVRLNPAEQGRLEKVPTLDVLSTTGVGTYGPYFQMKAVSDVNCRLAVAYAIDAKGILDAVYNGAGKVNRGVTPGMPPADDQVYFDYDPAKAKDYFDKCQGSAQWDKSKPLRIVFDKSFAGVEQWVPIMAQQLEAVGFKTELNGLDTTAAVAQYDKIDTYEIDVAQGGDQGLGPFRTQNYYYCPSVRGVQEGYIDGCPITQLFAQARKEFDPAKREVIFKQISGLLNKAVDRISLWTTNALSAKKKTLHGVVIPPNTREFIIGVQNWTLDNG
jgi:peptide/nickel transport system substrate-binding protein